MIRVTVTTCDRPHLLPALLSDIEREAAYVETEAAVYEDPTGADYGEAREVADRNGWAWHRFGTRLGRDGYPNLVSRRMSDCRASGADQFLFLPDDVRLVEGALAAAVETWELLEDPATLTLWRLKEDENQDCWTGLLPVDRGAAFEVFHVDGLYLCGRETLEFLGYRCPRVQRISGRTSSGVGRAMSLTLHQAGKRMYRVNRSLAFPVHGVQSVMNPDATDRRYPWAYL